MRLYIVAVILLRIVGLNMLTFLGRAWRRQARYQLAFSFHFARCTTRHTELYNHPVFVQWLWRRTSPCRTPYTNTGLHCPALQHVKSHQNAHAEYGKPKALPINFPVAHLADRGCLNTQIRPEIKACVYRCAPRLRHRVGDQKGYLDG